MLFCGTLTNSNCSYNSVISGAAAGRQYNVYVVDFFNTTSVWDLAGLEELKSSAWRNFQGTQVPVTCSTLEHPAYECLTNKQWQSLYDNKYVPDHGDLVLLVDTLAFNANWTIFSGADGNLTASLDGFNERSLGLQNRVVVNTSDYDPSYMPSFDFGPPRLIDASAVSGLGTAGVMYNPDDSGWSLSAINNSFGMHINSAYSQKLSDGSKVQVALPFIAIVILCNILKIIAMYMVTYRMPRHVLVTTGDAIASFLQRSDPATLGFCLSTESQIKSACKRTTKGAQASDDESIAWSEKVGKAPDLIVRKRLMAPLIL